MKAVFLGTGTSQGVPIIACDCRVCKSSDFRDKRLRSSILIQDNSSTIVVDSGPDFREQMLRAELKKLDALLFTHAHRDHMAGLDDIRGFNFRMKKAVDVFCEPWVEKAIRKEFYYAFEEPKYPGVPEMNLISIDENPFYAAGLNIQPIRVFHHKMPVLGFRFGEFAYITDANRIPEEEIEKLKGCRFLVLNALRREPHISHFTLNEALEIMERIQPERGFLTHISHQLGLQADLEKELPANVQLAYDGLEIEFKGA